MSYAYKYIGRTTLWAYFHVDIDVDAFCRRFRGEKLIFIKRGTEDLDTPNVKVKVINIKNDPELRWINDL